MTSTTSGLLENRCVQSSHESVVIIPCHLRHSSTLSHEQQHARVGFMISIGSVCSKCAPLTLDIFAHFEMNYRMLRSVGGKEAQSIQSLGGLARSAGIHSAVSGTKMESGQELLTQCRRRLVRRR